MGAWIVLDDMNREVQRFGTQEAATLHKWQKCPECGRVFDLLDEDDNNEWFYGHDCEDVR